MNTVICVNGRAADVPSGWKVTDLVDSLGYTGKRIAVEVNGQIVPKGALRRDRALRPGPGRDRRGRGRRLVMGKYGTKLQHRRRAAGYALRAGRPGLRLAPAGGTGKYRDFAQTRDAIDASGAEIVTVAIRR